MGIWKGRSLWRNKALSIGGNLLAAESNLELTGCAHGSSDEASASKR